MSTNLFGGKSSRAKVGEFCYHMPTRAILFSVLILSLVFTILIFPDHQTFLGFSWVFTGTVKYFCFRVLPLCLSLAPCIFTKYHGPLVNFWRFNGVNIVVFLHHGCGKGESLQTAKGHSLLVQTSLSNVGVVPNSAKSLWEPTQSLVWLGLNWKLVSGSISITEKSISSIDSVHYGSGLCLNRRPYYVHVTILG